MCCISSEYRHSLAWVHDATVSVTKQIGLIHDLLIPVRCTSVLSIHVQNAHSKIPMLVRSIFWGLLPDDWVCLPCCQISFPPFDSNFCLLKACMCLPGFTNKGQFLLMTSISPATQVSKHISILPVGSDPAYQKPFRSFACLSDQLFAFKVLPEKGNFCWWPESA